MLLHKAHKKWISQSRHGCGVSSDGGKATQAAWKMCSSVLKLQMTTLSTTVTQENMLLRSRFESLAVGSAAPSLYSLGCLCLKIINGPRRLFLMEEREENELCHLLMGDLRDERQKAGKQITSQKALVFNCKKNQNIFLFFFSISANTNVCWNIFNGSKIEMLLDRSVSYY